jgi:hypothetical protein
MVDKFAEAARLPPEIYGSDIDASLNLLRCLKI